MKIVQILGGLGNQMFQYAFLIALRERNGQSILMDTSLFDTYPIHNGFELSRLFNITAGKASDKEVHSLYWPFMTHSYLVSKFYRHYFPRLKTEIRERADGQIEKSILDDKRDLYYIGSWQDYRWFDSYKDIIKKEFTFKEPLDDKNAKYEETFFNAIYCSIHVRRGDYMKHKLYRGICGMDYYKSAISYVRNMFGDNIKYVVFSNDIMWCKENISPLLSNSEQMFVDWNIGQDSYKDMRLMGACKINIIANSSFSWWAAYLNKHDDNKVIAPRKWVNMNTKHRIQLPEWILF